MRSRILNRPKECLSDLANLSGRHTEPLLEDTAERREARVTYLFCDIRHEAILQEYARTL
jgi:hypothetical protein